MKPPYIVVSEAHFHLNLLVMRQYYALILGGKVQ